MKNLIGMFLLFACLGFAQEPLTPIPFSDADKVTVTKGQLSLSQLNGKLLELQNQYLVVQKQLETASVQLNQTLDGIVLQYIKEEDRDKYTLSPELVLVPKTDEPKD